MSTQHSPRTRTVVLFVVLLALLATSCSSGGDGAQPDDPTPDPDVTPTPAADTSGVQLISESSGTFNVRLSSGQGTASEAEPVSVVEGDPLTAQQVSAIIDRLPAWNVDPDDQVDFNRPPESLPPPRTGATITSTFPSSFDAPVPDVPSGPLEVLRVQPEGAVEIAPVISITFNQPMVPIATLDQLDSEDVPVTITPALPGRWQWIGTRTLRFEHDPELFDRLPMATDYTVEIPAGTTSEAGGVLASAVNFEFSTPPVQVQSFRPQGDGRKLDPIFVVVFDQRVDPEAVLETISIEAGGESRPISLATDAEIADDPEATRRVDQAKDAEGRWIAFRADQPFEPDTDIVVTIGPRTPSTEGPRLSSAAEVFTARTFAPLRVTDYSCNRDDDRCVPYQPLFVSFNNELDPELFDPSLITIEPELPGASISLQGRSIALGGAPEGRTTYEVTLPGNLTDVWGQTLGDDVDVRIPVGSAPPVLVPFQQPLITADPYADPPTVPVTSINHDTLEVEIYDVDPEDWPAYVESIERAPDEIRLPDWDRVAAFSIDTDADADQLSETAIDLSPVLDGEPGHLVVVVSTEKTYSRDDRDYWQNRPTTTWVQVTDIGLDAFNDQDRLVVWATDLATGEPLPGIDVELVPSSDFVRTNADGLADTDLPGTDTTMLVARTGDDAAILAAPYDEWRQRDRSDVARWHIFDDRAVYRPGETVSVKGWVRRLTLSGEAQLAPVSADADVSYVVRGPQGNELGNGVASLSSLGGFAIEFDVPANANLGWASLEVQLVGEADLRDVNGYHSFQIQEFRRPEFEVTARNESPGPHFRDEPATVAVEATYFAGGALPDAPVDWVVTTRDTSYRPPNWDDFSFGIWVPWWIFNGDFYDDGFGAVAFEEVGFAEDIGIGFPEPFDPGTIEEFSGVTDGSGTHYLRMDFDAADTDLPVTVSANASVTDVNRQAWGASTNLLVHPADVYIGLRSDRTFVRRGDPMPISSIVTDLDGNVVADRPVVVQAQRMEWRRVGGKWEEVPVDTQACEASSSTEPVLCEFSTDIGGKYVIAATVTDTSGRQNRSELTRWVSGGKQRPNRRLEQETVTLIPDKAEYQPGDVAEILVDAPFEGGQGLLTVSRGSIVSTEGFELDGPSAVLEIPIEDQHIPTLHIQVDVVGSTERVADDGAPLADAPARPAFAVGSLQLDIPAHTRTLTVEATPETDPAEPGEDTSIDVTVTDAAGAPVDGAEVALVVVDEAVLALSNYQTPDPISAFYGGLGSDLRSRYGRHLVLLENPLLLDAAGAGGDAVATADAGAEFPEEESASSDFAAEPAARSAQGEGAGGADPIDVRSNFDALAIFAPDVITDADGTATVDVALPDNLTRYRVMAIAVDGADQFGSTASNLTARLPLMVRPSAPRFLNFGDRFELPVVLQNQTEDDLEVQVVIEASNLTLTDRSGTEVTVPANDRIEVRFPTAAEEAGTARFRVAAVGVDVADAASVSLPVYTPATSEAFATYGVVDDQEAVIQPVLAPTDVWPQFGGLEVNTSSTALQALTDAVIYISEYPYRSSDARGSRILAITALRDVLAAFDAEGLPTPAELLRAVQDDIEALVGQQNGEGGFAIWRRFDESWPYHSVHVTHALVEARRNGYDVPQQTLDRALDYLRNIEEFYPSNYGPRVRATISSYALHVRDLAGDTDRSKAESLYRASFDDLSLEAVAWLWPVIDDAVIDAEIERLFTNRATETAGAATFATDYGEDEYLVLHSRRRTDGIILDALIAERPESDLIPKIVTGLLGDKTKGRWDNMQENTFILLALNNYFDTFEAEDPDFVARIWLGDLYAAEHTYEGRSIDRNETLVPMTELIEQGDSDLVVAKDGDAGRLYYRLGLRYAPSDLDLAPLDRGFVVQRVYEAIDDPSDVRLDDDDTWHIRAGAEVRVRLTMVADSRRTHVALVDPLPAGLEVLNPALAVTPEIVPDREPAETTYWYRRWFGHQNLRDDRAEAFTSRLRAGTYEYTYVARATTPGSFVTPPAKAEEMYAPENFGRSGTDIVIIEE